MQFFTTLKSASASFLLRPNASTPGIAIPAKDPHYVPKPIIEVAVAFSLSVYHAIVTRLKPLNTIAPENEKKVFPVKSTQNILSSVKANILDQAPISMIIAQSRNTVTT